MEDSATQKEAWILSAFLHFPFKQVIVKTPTLQKFVKGKGSSVLMVISLYLGNSAFTLIQKFANEVDLVI